MTGTAGAHLRRALIPLAYAALCSCGPHDAPVGSVSILVESDLHSFDFTNVGIQLLYQQVQVPLHTRQDSLPDLVYREWANDEMESYVGEVLTVELFAGDSTVLYSDTFTCEARASHYCSFSFWDSEHNTESCERIPLAPGMVGVFDTVFVYQTVYYPEPD